MTQKTQNSDSWTPCSPGELTGLATALTRRERRLEIQRWGGVAALLVFAFSTGWFVVHATHRPLEHNYGGITCSEVQDELPNYRAGAVADEMAARIKAHLAECPMCQAHMRQLGESAANAAQSVRRPDWWNSLARNGITIDWSRRSLAGTCFDRNKQSYTGFSTPPARSRSAFH